MILYILKYRSLDKEFLLVQARLLVPCSYVSGKIPYKYIVWKEKRKEYLWDHLVGEGHLRNRCLQIPKDRCVPEGYCFFVLSWFCVFTAIIYFVCLLTDCSKHLCLDCVAVGRNRGQNGSVPKKKNCHCMFHEKENNCEDNVSSGSDRRLRKMSEFSRQESKPWPYIYWSGCSTCKVNNVISELMFFVIFV